MRTLVLCSVLSLVSACGGKKEDKPTPGSGTAPVGPGSNGSAAVVPARMVEVFVDDKSIAKVSADQIGTWPRLDSLVPEASRRLGTWDMVQVVSAKATDVPKPSANYPDMVPALFPGERGPAFGMFDPVELAKHGKPAMREEGVREIRIKIATEGRSGDHQGGAGGDVDPSKLVIKIKTAAGESSFTGDKLLALPREAMPGQESRMGWRLTQLLEAAGIKKFEKLVVIDAAGASIVLERKDFDDKTTIPSIRLNRQGSLRFLVMKKEGDGWQRAGDLRSIATIQILK